MAEPVADPTLDLGRARARVGLAAVAVVCALTLGTGCAAMASDDDAIELPEPNRDGDVSVERALALRRSRREFAPEPLSLANASQLLWAAQGVSGSKGRRTAPSAGALYPLEVYLVAGAVSGLPPGVYHYEPEPHRLVRTVAGDVRARVAKAALGQDWIAQAPAIVVIAGVPHRTAWKYWGRASRYVHMEVGHAAQNVYLQAVALGLGATMVGAFRDDALAEVLDLPSLTEPLGLLPVGPYRKP